jgi:hypothetical protein
MREYYGIPGFYNADPQRCTFFLMKPKNSRGHQIFKKVNITIELLEGFLYVAAVLETGVEVVNVETGGGRHFTPRHRVPVQHQIQYSIAPMAKWIFPALSLL